MYPSNHRLRIEEGGEPKARAVPDGAELAGGYGASGGGGAARGELALRALSRSRSVPSGPPRRAAQPLRPCGATPPWSCSGRRAASESRAALLALDQGARALAQAGVACLAVALDDPEDLPKVESHGRGRRDGARDRGQPGRGSELRDSLPPPLHEPAGPCRCPRPCSSTRKEGWSRIYRRHLDVAEILQDAPEIEADPAERRARALPFAGTFLFVGGPEKLPPLRPGAARSGPRGPGHRRVRAGGPGEPERLHPLPPGDALREERTVGQGEGLLRTGARDAAGPHRGQQRPGRAPGPERRPPGSHRPVPRGPRSHPRLSRRSQQPGLRAPPDGPGGGGAHSLREGPEAPARFPRGPEQPRPHPRARGRPRPGGAVLPTGARQATRLRRGREQPGPGARDPRTNRRGDSSPEGFLGEEPRVREHATSRSRRSTSPRIAAAKRSRFSTASCKGTPRTSSPSSWRAQPGLAESHRLARPQNHPKQVAPCRWSAPAARARFWRRCSLTLLSGLLSIQPRESRFVLLDNDLRGGNFLNTANNPLTNFFDDPYDPS